MSIPKEQNLIITILSDFVNNKETTIDTDINLETLIRLSKSQEVSGIIYYQLQGIEDEVINAESIELLERRYASTLYDYQNRMLILSRIEKELFKEQIPFFIFKGSEIAKYYQKPALRTMGDCDILVKPEDKEKAHIIFKKLGLVRTESGPNEWMYDYKGIEFELHERLMNDDEPSSFDSHKAFMNRHWDYAIPIEGSSRHVLDISYHFVFLLLHLRKHFINSGVGLRQFMDLAVLVNTGELNLDYINNELEKLELTGFTKRCLALCEKWFGIISPYKTDIKDSFVKETVQNIFSGGIFGFDNEDNHDNYVLFQINRTGNTRLTRLKLTFKGLFPSYNAIKKVPHYSFIDGKPFLLPVAWIYRFFLSIFQGRAINNYKEASKFMDISKEQVDARTSYLKEWNL